MSSSESGASSSPTSSANDACNEIYEGDLIVAEFADAGRLEDLADVGVVTGHLVIEHANDLVDLRTLSCIREVGLALWINDNERLESLQGLEQLEYVGRADEPGTWGVTVGNNPVLTTLGGLSGLRETGLLLVNGNASLTSVSLDGIERLSSLALGSCLDQEGGPGVDLEDVVAGDNPMLTTIDGFASLQSLGQLSLTGQSALVSLAGLTERALAHDACVWPSTVGNVHRAKFRYNESLEVVEIEAFSRAAGIEAESCGNVGSEPECSCGIR